MPVPLLATDQSDIFIAGDVQIRAGAAVASGVILQADPGAQILIESGACIGVGSVLHANSGALIVGEGAILGAEVLLIGALTVGAKACIGAGSTVMNTAIASCAVISPSSVLTEYETTTRVSFTVKATESTEALRSFNSIDFEASTQHRVTATVADPIIPTPSLDDDLDSDPWGEESSSFVSANSVSTSSVSPPLPKPAVTECAPTSPQRSEPVGNALDPPNPQPDPPLTETKLGATTIYGKVRLNKLLVTLLPHRQLSDTGTTSAIDPD